MLMRFCSKMVFVDVYFVVQNAVYQSVNAVYGVEIHVQKVGRSVNVERASGYVILGVLLYVAFRTPRGGKHKEHVFFAHLLLDVLN